MKRALCLTLAALLAAFSAFHAPASEGAGARPLLRALAPFADLAADIEWIRFQRALQHGRHARALSHAESALSLAPHRTAGWELLASHLGLFLAATEREPDPAQRLAWLQAALSTLDRGIEESGARGEFTYLGGLILLTHAEQDPELPWPGGHSALWQAIAEAGDEAAKHGHPGGADLAAYAWEH